MRAETGAVQTCQKIIFSLHADTCTDADMHNIFSQAQHPSWLWMARRDGNPSVVLNSAAMIWDPGWWETCCLRQCLCCYTVQTIRFYTLCCHFFSLNHSSRVYKLARLQRCHPNDGLWSFLCAVNKSHHFRGPWCSSCCHDNGLHMKFLIIFSSQQLLRELSPVLKVKKIIAHSFTDEAERLLNYSIIIMGPEKCYLWHFP